jgi:hypothetical protein
MAAITLAHQSSNTGQISLESALFCLECEIIFVGEVSCPRCTGEAVWPLAEWIHPIRAGVDISKRESDLPEISQNERHEKTNS